MTSRQRFFVTFLALAVPWACGPQQPVDPTLPTTQKCTADPEVPTDGAAILVGYGGTNAFKVLVPGAELPLQHGPQGGTHVYLDVLFHADTAGRWKIASQLTRPSGGSLESDTFVTNACAGWNRIDNVRFVLYGGGGDGALEVRASTVDPPQIELKSAPIVVSIK